MWETRSLIACSFFFIEMHNTPRTFITLPCSIEMKLQRRYFLSRVCFVDAKKKENQKTQNNERNEEWKQGYGVIALYRITAFFSTLSFWYKTNELAPLHIVYIAHIFIVVFSLSVALVDFTILQEEKWEEVIKRPSSWFHKFIYKIAGQSTL